MVIIRGKKTKTIKVKLEEMPADASNQTSTSSESTSKLGLTVQPLTPNLARQYGIDADEEGVLVTDVERNSEAGKAINAGDLIQRIGDRKIKNLDNYNSAMEESAGEYILVLVKRKDNTFFVTLKIEE